MCRCPNPDMFTQKNPQEKNVKKHAFTIHAFANHNTICYIKNA